MDERRACLPDRTPCCKGLNPAQGWLWRLLFPNIVKKRKSISYLFSLTSHSPHFHLCLHYILQKRLAFAKVGPVKVVEDIVVHKKEGALQDD